MTQPYEINFYQISGASTPGGLGNNATLIATIVTAPGIVNTPGDWYSFSNLTVLLKPNTTNAFTWGRLASGSGYMAMPLVSTSTGTWPGPFAGGVPCGILLAGGNSSVNYAAGTVVNGVEKTNYDTAFSIGMSTIGFVPAWITTTNPFPGDQLVAGGTATFAASGQGTQPCSGYWQKNTGSGWVTLKNGGNISGATTVASATSLDQVGALVVANVSTADVGSYQMVITNSLDGVTISSATSSVVTLSVVSAPPANSFASVVLTPSYGAVVYWPLNETSDPSTRTAEAYDIVGGYNGFYGVNANNGGGNAADGSLPFKARRLPGCPVSPPLLWLLQNTLYSTFVTTAASPTFPANQTNVTMVAWVYPNLAAEASSTGVAVMRAGTAGPTGPTDCATTAPLRRILATSGITTTPPLTISIPA